MTTLIEALDKDGKVHRCDSRCYDASPDEKCKCICGGANHGVGNVVAHNQTYALGDQWIARAVAHNGEPFVWAKVYAKGVQQGLFKL